RTTGYFLSAGAAYTVLEGFGNRALRWDLPVAVVVLWLVAAWLDRAAVPVGHVARGTIVYLVALNVPFGPPALVGVTAALATVILTVDAVQLERVEVGYAAAGTVQVAVAAAAVVVGYTL